MPKKISRLTLLLLLIPVLMIVKADAPQSRPDLQVGADAPELELPNSEGVKMALSELEGEVVLVDFWASWCRPCRVNHPELVNAYRKYMNATFKGGERGFAIYSVSLDTDRESWLKAIEQDRLEWDYHVNDLEGWESPAVKRYKVRAIPASFILDGEGRIIRKNVSGDLDQFLEGYRK